MRFVWLFWLKAHFGTYGYSQGWMNGVLGTVAVLATAATVWVMLHHRKPVAAHIVAGVVCAVGIGWLAAH